MNNIYNCNNSIIWEDIIHIKMFINKIVNKNHMMVIFPINTVKVIEFGIIEYKFIIKYFKIISSTNIYNEKFRKKNDPIFPLKLT